MNSKAMLKKQVKRPLQTSSVGNTPMTSNSRVPVPNSIYKSLNCKMVTIEDYNKMQFQNIKLAREHACLKSQLGQYKDAFHTANNQNAELKQQLSSANAQIKRLEVELKNKTSVDMNQINDRVKHTIGLLAEEYLAIDDIKHQINQFGNKMETIKGVMSSLLSNVENTSEGEATEDMHNSFLGLNSSGRLSMSSQERDQKRRRSSDMIRRDFQVLHELSTILEMSCENRMSSLGGIVESNADNCSASVVRTVDSVSSAGMSLLASNASTTSSELQSIASTSSAANMAKKVKNVQKGKKGSDKQKSQNEIKPKTKKVSKATKENKPKKGTKTKTTTKNVKDNTKSTEASEKANESMASVYDYNEEDKENIVPEFPMKRARLDLARQPPNPTYMRNTRSKKQFS